MSLHKMAFLALIRLEIMQSRGQINRAAFLRRANRLRNRWGV